MIASKPSLLVIAHSVPVKVSSISTQKHATSTQIWVSHSKTAT